MSAFYLSYFTLFIDNFITKSEAKIGSMLLTDSPFEIIKTIFIKETMIKNIGKKFFCFIKLIKLILWKQSMLPN